MKCGVCSLQVKCHQYWPLGEDDEDEEMVFDEVALKVTLQEETETPHYSFRTFDLENLQVKWLDM